METKGDLSDLFLGMVLVAKLSRLSILKTTEFKPKYAEEHKADGFQQHKALGAALVI